MARINHERRSKRQLQRAMLLKAKLLENGIIFADVAKELGMDKASITKFAYGDFQYKNSRVRTWVEEKLGVLFMEELDRMVA
ncbi:MAG: hypothetical protein AB1706_10300 [Pseudomonadota bacterium]